MRKPHDRASRTRRRRSASTPRTGDLGRATCSSGSTFRRGCSPRSSRRARRSAADAEVADGTGSAARRRRGRHARHRLGGRGGAVRRSPARRSSASARGRSSGVEVDRPLIDDATLRGEPDATRAASAGTFRLLRNVTGLWLLHECRRAWAARGPGPLVRRAGRAGAAAPPLRSLDRPERPGRSRRRATCRRASPTTASTRVSRRRQIPARSSAASSRASPSSTRRRSTCSRAVTGASPVELHVVGGGARNELLCGWTAQTPPACRSWPGRRRRRWSATCSSRRWRSASSRRSRRPATVVRALVRPDRLRADAVGRMERGAGALRRAGRRPTRWRSAQ